jgi:hypothetical protein
MPHGQCLSAWGNQQAVQNVAWDEIYTDGQDKGTGCGVSLSDLDRRDIHASMAGAK